MLPVKYCIVCCPQVGKVTSCEPLGGCCFKPPSIRPLQVVRMAQAEILKTMGFSMSSTVVPCRLGNRLAMPKSDRFLKKVWRDSKGENGPIEIIELLFFLKIWCNLEMWISFRWCRRKGRLLMALGSVWSPWDPKATRRFALGVVGDLPFLTGWRVLKGGYTSIFRHLVLLPNFYIGTLKTVGHEAMLENVD